VTEARYESKTVKVLRGTEGRSITKWEKDGWELVDQATGTARSTLTFRKAKRPVPVRALAIGGASVVAVAAIVTGGVLLFGGGDGSEEQASSPSAVTTGNPTTAPSATTAASSTPPSATTDAAEGTDGSTAPVTDTTVDVLLDRLNSAGLGGIAVGDRFRVTGQLFESDAWGVGATGEYSVYFEAAGGADDLLVFVNESDAAGWVNGTVVTMVLESVEVTINGETTDGWLRAQMVQTVAE